MICSKECRAYDDEVLVEGCLFLSKHVGENAEAPAECPIAEDKAALERLQKTVREFLSILDVQEEGDSGTPFHPTTINSCRVLTLKRIGELLEQMKESIKWKQQTN